jgi:PAS domain S-box-containing protein
LKQSRFLRSLRFTTILALYGVTILLVALSAFGIGHITLSERFFRESIRPGMETTADLIHEFASAAIAFHSPIDMDQLWSGFNKDGPYRGIGVYDINGRIFSRYGDVEDLLPADIEAQSLQVTFNRAFLQKPIMLSGRQVGTLKIVRSLEGLRNKQRRGLFIMAIVAFAALLVTVGYIARMRKVMAKPVDDLVRVTKRVSEQGDYSIRAPVHGIAEIQMIANSFNLALEEIEKRQKETLQLNAELQQSNKIRERLSQAIEQAGEAVVMTDHTGTITYNNPAFEIITGYSSEEALGLHITILESGAHDAEFYEAVWTCIQSGKTWSGRFKNKRKDGSLYYQDTVISPVRDDQGTITHYISVAHDASHEIELQNKLMQAQKMESIGTLAGGIAHDFNNILSAIIGFTELAIDETPKDSPIEDSLREVYSAGIRAKDLVKQILAFARQSDEKRSPIKPGMVAKEVLKLIRATIPTTIEIESQIESDSLIFGNQTQIHQVLMNLCTNAAHAMEDSGGVLAVSMHDSFFEENELPGDMTSGKYIEIRVSDTGVGIAPENMNLIFEPYFTTKDIGEGTGMGLSMVHGVVESYGGKITVETQLGKGTKFTIYLPITEKSSARENYVPEQLPTGIERILFVDDEASIVKMGSRLLERLGYSVATCTNSIDALELFRTKPDDFDLIVTDMTMPNLTGDKLALEVMRIRPGIPVILCTGYSKKISDESASEIGIKAFAYKPLAKADLAKTVREVLDKAKS